MKLCALAGAVFGETHEENFYFTCRGGRSGGPVRLSQLHRCGGDGEHRRAAASARNVRAVPGSAKSFGHCGIRKLHGHCGRKQDLAVRQREKELFLLYTDGRGQRHLPQLLRGRRKDAPVLCGGHERKQPDFVDRLFFPRRGGADADPVLRDLYHQRNGRIFCQCAEQHFLYADERERHRIPFRRKREHHAGERSEQHHPFLCRAERDRLFFLEPEHLHRKTKCQFPLREHGIQHSILCVYLQRVLLSFHGGIPLSAGQRSRTSRGKHGRVQIFADLQFGAHLSHLQKLHPRF